MVAALGLLLVRAAVPAAAAQDAAPLWDTGTFSILAFDPATGEVGDTIAIGCTSCGGDTARPSFGYGCMSRGGAGSAAW